MTPEEYFGDWCQVINVKMAEDIIERLKASNRIICPRIADVFRAFRLCPLSRMRVMVIGQDPYNNYLNNKPVATGVAFANNKDTKEEDYSPSLEVLRESIIDFSLPHGRINFDPSLEKWEEQGVVMLNASLTCQMGEPLSHTLLWMPFMQSLLTNVSESLVGIVFVLLGNSAKSLEPFIDKQFHHIIKEKHPSWYVRNGKRMPNIWKQVNEILIGQNDEGIKWYEEEL